MTFQPAVEGPCVWGRAGGVFCAEQRADIFAASFANGSLSASLAVVGARDFCAPACVGYDICSNMQGPPLLEEAAWTAAPG